jgi:oligopeptidase B
MDAGHGGASGRFQRLKEIALEYAFIFDLEGISK